MADKKPPLDIPEGGLDTPHGRLYPPPSTGRQVLTLIVVFIGSPGLGWLVGLVPGDLSDAAGIMLAVPYVLIFFIGYAIWVARLGAIAFDTVGASIFKALWMMLIRQKKADALKDVIPSQDNLLEMAVRAQKAGGSFAWVGWPMGILAGLASLLVDTAMSSMMLGLITFTTCVLWGHLLGRLGRRGWLPFPEEE